MVMPMHSLIKYGFRALGARRCARNCAEDADRTGPCGALRLMGTAGIKHVTPIRGDECYSGVYKVLWEYWVLTSFKSQKNQGCLDGSVGEAAGS